MEFKATAGIEIASINAPILQFFIKRYNAYIRVKVQVLTVVVVDNCLEGPAGSVKKDLIFGYVNFIAQVLNLVY